MGMVVFGISMLTNTCLNYILIFGKFGAPAMGITGAAIATLISRVVEVVIVALYAPRYRRVPLNFRLLLRPGWDMVRSFLKYATPVLVNEVLWGLGVSVMTAIMGHMAISTDMLAAYAIMGNIDKFSTVACFGVAGAAAVIVGKRIGERADREEVYSLGCCLLAVSFGVGLVVSLCLAVLLPTVFIPYLYPLFHLEGLALEIAVIMCVVYLFMLPMKAFDITNITGVLRAGGDVRMATIIDLCPLWLVAVPLAASPPWCWTPPCPWSALHLLGEHLQNAPGAWCGSGAGSGSTTSQWGAAHDQSFPLPRLRGAAGPGGADLPLSQPAQLRHRPGGLHLPAAPQSEALRRPRG